MVALLVFVGNDPHDAAVVDGVVAPAGAGSGEHLVVGELCGFCNDGRSVEEASVNVEHAHTSIHKALQINFVHSGVLVLHLCALAHGAVGGFVALHDQPKRFGDTRPALAAALVIGSEHNVAGLRERIFDLGMPLVSADDGAESTIVGGSRLLLVALCKLPVVVGFVVRIPLVFVEASAPRSGSGGSLGHFKRLSDVKKSIALAIVTLVKDVLGFDALQSLADGAHP